MKDSKLVWSDEQGDLRKSKDKSDDTEVIESQLKLNLRRLTSGKGRTIIEISNLPNNKNWCKKLTKEIKKKLGTGGSYKNNLIEIHGECLDQLKAFLSMKAIEHKQIGG